MATRVGMKPKKEPVAIPAPAKAPEPVETPKKVTKRGRKKAEK